jgi:uncharacterized protein
MSIQSWNQICRLREDVRKGELSLAEFAADLNDVRTGNAPTIYRDANMFFDRTYPTFRMKELTRDVLKRLAGQGGKPVLRLQVAYGGGKTHTLITLLHLAERGNTLNTHRTVREFLAFAGLSDAPTARVALLPCDKLDVNEGMEVYGPDGSKRQVHTLWGALAYQLAGDAGYTRLKAHDEENTVPAEPLLVDLLKAPLKDNLGTLVLVDEAVWYYRQAVLKDPRMLGAIKDFFQVLNQAVSKVERASMVASLIASRLEANDQTGTQCLTALDDVFQRIAEPVEPVTREDVAEILRRRLFENVPGESERRPIIDSLMAGLQKLPVPESRYDQTAYNRWMDSYPFHPELINVLYQKWTQMNGFQRTRGALRLLAYALRDSEAGDTQSVVGVESLLPYGIHGQGLSSALNELVEICDATSRWTPILTGELAKTKDIQALLPTLNAREVEQAVVAAFLHSQPIGQHASTAELLELLVHPTVDASAIDEGLRKWRDKSWFLVENPDVWQLGTTANLTHMHIQAIGWLNESEIDDELRTRIKNVSTLKAADGGVEVHALPISGPRDISDDLKLHYVILGPECSVELGKPLPVSVEAYFNQVTGPENPRTYRNNILALAPEVSRLAGLREQVRRYLGWVRMEKPDVQKLLTDTQRQQLPGKKQEAVNNLPESVVAAYNILVAVDEDGIVRAQPLRTSGAVGGTPFDRIKVMLTEDERLVTVALDPELILPGSYFALWSEGQMSRRVIDIVQAFSQFPRLPRLLRSSSLYETLRRGVQSGVLVVRLPRADGSTRTWWRIPPDDDTMLRPELELLSAQNAVLENIDIDLLKPGQLDGLWSTSKPRTTFANLVSYFDGNRAPRIVSEKAIRDAVLQAVGKGFLMAQIENVAFYGEVIPETSLVGKLELLPPPISLHGADLLKQFLPNAWSDDSTSLNIIADALATKAGHAIPWGMLANALDEALNLHLVELDPSGGNWPCSPVLAGHVSLRVPENIELTAETISKALTYTGSSTPSLRAIKDALEAKFFGGKKISLDIFVSKTQEAIDGGLLEALDQGQSGNPLVMRVKIPSKTLFAEAQLSPAALQEFAENIEKLINLASELTFTFRVSISAEGKSPDEELIKQLNGLLDNIKSGWKLG